MLQDLDNKTRTCSEPEPQQPEGEMSRIDAPTTFKLFVWEQFELEETIKGFKVTDKTKTLCKRCKKMSMYRDTNREELVTEPTTGLGLNVVLLFRMKLSKKN